MKLSSIILVGGAGLIAIVVGWIYQSQSEVFERRSKLEIPVDIDYYLSGVNYRVFAKDGKLDYRIQTPYLQHYKVEGISRIDNPNIDVFRNDSHWQITAKVGSMRHQDNTMQLTDDVSMQKQGDAPMQFSAQQMLFEPDRDLVVVDRQVKLINGNAVINADRAVFDLDKNIYRLTNSKTTYYRENS